MTNAFFKNVEAHESAVALHFMHYNFCHFHQSIRMMTAMAAGIADHVWSISEIVALLDPKTRAASAA